MFIVILTVLGVCFGSFVNALVWRLHEQAKPKKKRAANDKDLSIATGRSMCPQCQHVLNWRDLLPVVSWLYLRGKCRYCHKTISWQYPLVEIFTAGLFVFSYHFWPSPISDLPAFILFGFWLVFLVGFMALTVYDLRWQILPDRIVFPMQKLAVVFVIIQALTTNTGWGGIFVAALGVMFSAGIFYLLFQVSAGRWIGGGDVKLAVVLGLLIGGPVNALMMLFIASMLGSVVGIPLLLFGKAKRNTKLPFGPFLILATIIVFLFGTGLINWYKHQLLLV